MPPDWWDRNRLLNWDSFRQWARQWHHSLPIGLRPEQSASLNDVITRRCSFDEVWMHRDETSIPPGRSMDQASSHDVRNQYCSLWTFCHNIHQTSAGMEWEWTKKQEKGWKYNNNVTRYTFNNSTSKPCVNFPAILTVIGSMSFYSEVNMLKKNVR